MTDTVRYFGLSIEHRHGVDQWLFATPEERDAQLATYVAEWWDEEMDTDEYGTLDSVAEDERVETYFEHQDDESYLFSEFDMPVLGDLAGLTEALQACAQAASGDSNDDEIAALNEALEYALERWPGVVRPDPPDPFADDE